MAAKDSATCRTDSFHIGNSLHTPLTPSPNLVSFSLSNWTLSCGNDTSVTSVTGLITRLSHPYLEPGVDGMHK